MPERAAPPRRGDDRAGRAGRRHARRPRAAPARRARRADPDDAARDGAGQRRLRPVGHDGRRGRRRARRRRAARRVRGPRRRGALGRRARPRGARPRVLPVAGGPAARRADRRARRRNGGARRRDAAPPGRPGHRRLPRGARRPVRAGARGPRRRPRRPGARVSTGVVQVLAALAFAAAAAGLAVRLRLGLGGEIVRASGRAVVQLAVVGLIVAAVFRFPVLSAVFVAAMATAAALTSGGRLRGLRHPRLSAAVAIAPPALGATGLLVLVGAFEATPRAVVPTAGILLGGAMAATTLTGRRMLEGLRDDRDEIETRLCLG
ncbi:MAG: hypothetical protein F2817_02200, partial [Actinobacteria bacterium]|nr:hypothetical protein [Actinomycetota bacterium]